MSRKVESPDTRDGRELARRVSPLTNREHLQKRRAYSLTFAIVAMVVGAVIGGSLPPGGCPAGGDRLVDGMQPGPSAKALPGPHRRSCRMAGSSSQEVNSPTAASLVASLLYDPARGEWTSAAR